MATYEVPLLGGLPATDFIGRQIRATVGDEPAYYKLLGIVDDKFLTIEMQTGNGKRPVRVKAVDCGPNWSRNPDLQSKAKKLREESAKPRAMNSLSTAFDVAQKPPAPPPEPVAATKVDAPAERPAPAPEIKPTPMPEEKPTTAAEATPTTKPPGKRLLSFHAPPDTDFGWTEDMKKLRLAISDHEQLGVLLQEAEETIARATAAVEGAGVRLVWEGSEEPAGDQSQVLEAEVTYLAGLPNETAIPMTVEQLAKAPPRTRVKIGDTWKLVSESGLIPAGEPVNEEKIMREWAEGPGKQVGEFTAAEGVDRCGLPVHRLLGLRMSNILGSLGYCSRKRPGLLVKSYYWKD